MCPRWFSHRGCLAGISLAWRVVKTQIPGSHPRVSDSWDLGWGPERVVLLTVSMAMLLVWGPHSEDHCPREIMLGSRHPLIRSPGIFLGAEVSEEGSLTRFQTLRSNLSSEGSMGRKGTHCSPAPRERAVDPRVCRGSLDYPVVALREADFWVLH